MVLGHSFLFFGLCKWFGCFRVSPAVELQGLDVPEMGTPAYPDFYTHVVDAGHVGDETGK